MANDDFNREEFNRFLRWLDPDTERAGQRYEEIRRRMIRIAISRGCFEAEEAADETFSRAIRLVQEIADEYVGDPARFCYGVLKNVLFEYLRRRRPIPPPPAPDAPDVKELRDRCLRDCLDRLSREDQRIALRYYSVEGKAKDARSKLAEELKIRPNALRIRAHRIRTTLEPCVVQCVADGLCAAPA